MFRGRMLLRSGILVIAAAVVLGLPSSRAMTAVTKLDSAPSPVRVQAVSIFGIRVFSESGLASTDLTVSGSRRKGLAVSTEAQRAAKSFARSDIAYFADDGRMAYFDPTGESEEIYVQSFDATKRRFVGEALPIANVRLAVAGARGIALLVDDVDSRDRMSLPSELQLVIIERDNEQCHPVTRWTSNEYTAATAIDNNASEDVVALVGRRRADGSYERFRLIAARQGGRVTEYDVNGVGASSQVTISPDGQSVAIATGAEVTVYRLDSSLIPGPRLSLGACTARGGLTQLRLSECVAAYSTDDVYALVTRFMSDTEFFVMVRTRDPAQAALEVMSFK